MSSPHSRLATPIIVGLFVAAACTSAATPAPATSSASPPPPSPSPIPTTPVASSASTPVVTPTPTPAAPPTASPTRSADATLRVVDLAAILDVAEADRFETFGDESILLEHVWSPRDLGLGGVCGPANVPWLECLNVPDWLIQPSSDDAGYDGGRLGILYEPRLGERLDAGDGPVDVIGHFGDPASEGCRPENRAACRDRFVVTAIEKAGS